MKFLDQEERKEHGHIHVWRCESSKKTTAAIKGLPLISLTHNGFTQSIACSLVLMHKCAQEGNEATS